MTSPFTGLVFLSGLQNVNANTATATYLGVGGANISPSTPLNVKGDAKITGSLIVTNNFTVQGTATTINSQIIESSNIVINNAGTGPGIYVKQTGAQDIADFLDESGSIFKIADSGLITIGGTGSGSLTNKVSITGNLAASGLNTCITDSTSTTSSTLAASATAVKSAYDLANAALPKAGGILTGGLQLNEHQISLGSSQNIDNNIIAFNDTTHTKMMTICQRDSGQNCLSIGRPGHDDLTINTNSGYVGVNYNA